MDILSMLQNDEEELCEEDIQMIQEELDVGKYQDDYKRQCQFFINRLRKEFMKRKEPKAFKDNAKFNPNDYKVREEIVDGNQKQETIEETSVPKAEKIKTNSDLLKEKLEDIRGKIEYFENFKKYILDTDYVTEEFIDKNIKEFKPDEITELMRIKTFSEPFLEKYLSILDPGTLAVTQLFSEEFFMKHYNELKSTVVLRNSKNEWRTKSKRSNKLNAFLRLKGVKI